MNSYLILFHKNNLVLNELISCIDSPIFIHPCLSLRTNGKNFNSSYSKKVKVIKRHKGNWGGFGIVRATIEGLRDILSSHPKTTHITLLSGADYPIKPIDSYEAYLAKNTDVSFMKYWGFYPFRSIIEEKENPWHNGYNVQKLRITKYYFDFFNKRYSIPPLENNGYFDLNSLQKIKHFLKYRAKGFTGKYDEEFIQLFYSYFLKMPKPIKADRIFGGSQWWTICRKHAEYIVSEHYNNKTRASFFKHTMLPDETYIQTILLTSPYKAEVINNNLRHIRFEGNTYHPVTFTATNFEELQQSDAYFARKFDEKIDINIISMIKDKLI